MKIATHLLVRVALPLLAFSLVSTSVQAKEGKPRGSGHARSTIYFQAGTESGANDWYTPPRDPGRHQLIGS